jgi:hypothetical protein
MNFTLSTGDLKNNRRRQLSDYLPKGCVQMVIAGMALYFIKQSNVEAYYRGEVYLHAFFTTA